MTSPSLVRRVAVREYGPLAAMVVAWLAIGLTAGHADAVRLFAALTFVRAARSLTAPATLVPLRKRLRGGQHAAQATRVALFAEVLAMPFAAAVLAAILSFLYWAEQGQLVLLCLLFALALPARTLVPLLARREFNRLYRPIVAVVGLALIGAGAAVRADIAAFALLFAAREWLALLLSFVLAPRVPVTPKGTIDVLRWPEIAEASHARARKQAAYRFSKVFLVGLLGPFGTIAARTGRGLKMDRKAARFVPAQPAVLVLLAIASASGSAALVLLIPEPILLVLAATLLRVTSAAGAILMWSMLSSRAVGDAGQDDDDGED